LGKVRLDIRKKFYTERLVKHWKKLSREVVITPRLLVFSKQWCSGSRGLSFGCPFRSWSP